MNAYNIVFTSNESFDALVTICNSNAPLQYLETIEKELSSCNFVGNVLMDQILHVGNTDERFLSFNLDRSGIIKDSIRFVKISKTSVFREISCKFLNDEQLIEASILSELQKKMIRNGLSI
ncbi:MAG: type II toxin-antitoxin system RnlB family antitoxin [Methanosarcinaceae archaeon]|nr:type II toxin-antitoxin system RnlB family antitoxin [Methanosarcinaceae archaeon]